MCHFRPPPLELIYQLLLPKVPCLGGEPARRSSNYWNQSSYYLKTDQATDVGHSGLHTCLYVPGGIALIEDSKTAVDLP